MPCRLVVVFTCVEICAGAGGQALGLELAGFEHRALVEIDQDCCATLAANRPHWNVVCGDVKRTDLASYRDVDGGLDLLAGGVPCPPFSIAGLRKGAEDERDLFPRMLELVEQLRPRAVLIENVPGLAEKAFKPYLDEICFRLAWCGYNVAYRVLKAFEHGVPQLRPRFVLVALRRRFAAQFRWPYTSPYPYTVGDVCLPHMASRGWEGAKPWYELASVPGGYAPTIVAGSRIHGGPDMGPSRSRERWRNLGFSSKSVANEDPAPGEVGPPRVTLAMLAAIQGFPADWQFVGKKTSRWKQIGNAFPAPVAAAVAKRVATALAVGHDSRFSADLMRAAA